MLAQLLLLEVNWSDLVTGRSDIETYIRGERDTVVTFAKLLKHEHGIHSKHVGMGSTPTTSSALDNISLEGGCHSSNINCPQ